MYNVGIINLTCPYIHVGATIVNETLYFADTIVLNVTRMDLVKYLIWYIILKEQTNHIFVSRTHIYI